MRDVFVFKKKKKKKTSAWSKHSFGAPLDLWTWVRAPVGAILQSHEDFSVCLHDGNFSSQAITALGHKPTHHRINTAPAHHTPHTTHHRPDNLMLGEREKEARATARGGRARSGWAASEANCSGAAAAVAVLWRSRTTCCTTHHHIEIRYHTLQQHMMFGERVGVKGYSSRVRRRGGWAV